MEVAWNQVRVSELVSNKEERDRLFAEIRVLKQLKHKNIMTFYDSWLDPKTYCINFITELFTSGTLRQCAPVATPLVLIDRQCGRQTLVSHCMYQSARCAVTAKPCSGTRAVSACDVLM